MDHLVAEIEGMIASYIAARFDDDALRTLNGPDLENKMTNDEDAVCDFKDRIYCIVIDEIDWNKIVAKAQENLPDDDEDENIVDED